MCKDRASDQLFAMKILNKDFLKKKKQGNTTETYEEDIRREIAIMKKLSHPNVLKLYEVLDDPNVNKLYLVLEYMKRGDLLHFLSERDAEDPSSTGMPQKRRNSGSFTPVNERELWIIFRQVVHGVKYLHQHNIVHGDIKVKHIVLT
jgi:[calcium/calmodulin-dependent protein kinase] kinase